MIHLRKLVKYYGPRLAVDHVDLDIEAGRIVGFLGPNGAGKTTTIRMLTAFMPPTSGTATVNGHDILNESMEVRQSIGYLPESTPLYHELKVIEQLHYFGKLRRMDRRTRSTRINALTDSCGLGQILNRPVGVLSKGNKQRVGLAQAMLHDPPILILDEPTAGLDPTQITEVRKLIQRLGEKKTILLSTHILPEVEKSCEQVVIVHEGKIIADGTPDQLIEKARASSRVIIEVKANSKDVQRSFQNIKHVRSVETTSANGWCKAWVAPKRPTHDLRELLSEVILENKWHTRLMTHETASLEEFFVQATSTTSGNTNSGFTATGTAA